MIRNQHKILSLTVLVLFISLFSIFAPLAKAQITYTVNKEWAKIWINNDGSIDLQYNITLTYLSAPPEGPAGIVTVGMPQGGFHDISATDISGSSLQYDDVSKGSFYGIDVYLNEPVILNTPNTFIVYAVVPGMVSLDETNPGNVGMLFYPTTFSSASGSIADLRVAIVLPQGVNGTSVRWPLDSTWNSTGIDAETNNLYVYWEMPGWPPGQTFISGVSFPEEYVSLPPSGGPSFDIGSILPWIIFAIPFIFILAAIVIAITGILRKAVYLKPQISVEALGAMRSLTAVEAGVILGQKPVRSLTMILYGLLLKRKATVTETDPLIKLQRLESPADQPTTALRYYEIDYLKAIKPDGTLDDTILAKTYLGLTDTVNQKLRGYSREDTVNYYKSIVNQAWTQVTQAGTPELKGDAIDKNIEWLLTDEKFDERFKTAFPPDIVILPMPGWGWYWGGPHFPTGQAGQRNIPSTTPTAAKPIPGQDFANNIVRGLEKTSNNIVKNVQDFANRLVPAQAAATKEQSVRGKSSCVCACHACACACACVGCACACAGGGAR